jgi:molybdopterin-containing oxidoreductase family membrane subunit
MKLAYRELEGGGGGYFALLGLLALAVLAGLWAAHEMETAGHVITGMNNHIVWGLPHVFAVFLIVAASGALNAASLASVFGQSAYKPLARLSGVLAVALLAGGLAVLVLDLGRPERLTVAMTHYNFRSIFAWNVFLYTGFFAVVAIYLLTLMDRSLAGAARVAGWTAFLWRLLLTTGTGSIFGFLLARETFHSAVMAPTFIAYSFSYGTAMFIVVLLALSRAAGREVPSSLIARLSLLQAAFIAVALYFVALFHLTQLYTPAHREAEHFLLMEGGSYSVLFWLGQIGLGSVLPLLLLIYARHSRRRGLVVAAALLVLLGGLLQMYVTLIGGQAYPLRLFPGLSESGGFGEGEVQHYRASLPEWLLGIGGLALALLMVFLAPRFLRLLPEHWGDEEASA